MTTQSYANDDAAKNLLAASSALRRALEEYSRSHAGIREFVVRVGGMTPEPPGGGQTTAVSKPFLIVTIEAESQAHAEEHAQVLVDQGCSCSSTGEASVECDFSGL
jgi:hypothetical protein